LSSEHTQPDDLADLDDMDGTESTASFEGRILSKQGDGPVVLECRRGRREGSRDDDNAMTGRSWKGGKCFWRIQLSSRSSRWWSPRSLV